MKRLFLLGVLLLAIAASGRAVAADAFGAWTNGLPTGWVEGPTCDPYVDYNCTPSKAVMALKSGVNGPCDPYVNYKCLDEYLGDNVAVRFFRYYQLEWGKGVAPSDPSAPPSRRSDTAWPPTPESSPPEPFTEWPYGGTQNIGVTRPEFCRLAANGCDRQYRFGQMDERRPHSGLWLGQRRRQYQHQQGEARRQRASRV